MKNMLFLVLLIVLASCTKTPTTSQRYIEPCEYNIMSFEVKDVAYFDSVAGILQGNPSITISGESKFNVTKELGEYLFNGYKFTYKIIRDSLILSNDKQRQAYFISDLDPNSFRLKVNHKFFSRIDLVKPVDKRRRIEKTVTIKY